MSLDIGNIRKVLIKKLKEEHRFWSYDTDSISLHNKIDIYYKFALFFLL